METLESLAARVATLERENARLRRWRGAAAVLALAAAAMAPAFPDETVSAARFDLLDGDGGVRASLAMSDEGHPGLVLRDADGTSRAFLGLDGTGTIPFLSLNDPSGAPRAQVAGAAGGPSVSFYDEIGTRVANLDPFVLEFDGSDGVNDLRLFANGLSSGLTLRDSPGASIAFLTILGAPEIEMTDWRGKVRFRKRPRTPPPP
jgi:hypothetical protein